MTLLDVAYRYGRPPGEAEMRALKEIRQVYGIWRTAFDEPNNVIRIEYDGSRLNDDDVTALLRNAGFDLIEKVPQIPPAQPVAA